MGLPVVPAHWVLPAPPAGIHERPVPVVDRMYPAVGVEPETDMDATFRVVVFAVVTKTFVVVRAFDT